jgi:hypothetical protein
VIALKPVAVDSSFSFSSAARAARMTVHYGSRSLTAAVKKDIQFETKRVGHQLRQDLEPLVNATA